MKLLIKLYIRLGITTAIGIGGDPIIGTTTKDAVELLINDNEAECVVMIGEIEANLKQMLQLV